MADQKPTLTVPGLSAGNICLIANVTNFMNSLVKKATTNGTAETFGSEYITLYHATKIPKFTQTTVYNPRYTIKTGVNGGPAPTLTNISKPEAIISEDLDSTGSISSVVSPQKAGQVMTASLIMKGLIEIVRQVSRVHRFRSIWYHSGAGAESAVEELKGTGIFKANLSNGQIGTDQQGNTSTCLRTRTLPEDFYTTPTLTDSERIKAGSTLEASALQNVMNVLYQKWIENIGKTIEYRIYSCHYNCHSNCHGSRGRR